MESLSQKGFVSGRRSSSAASGVTRRGASRRRISFVALVVMCAASLVAAVQASASEVNGTVVPTATVTSWEDAAVVTLAENFPASSNAVIRFQFGTIAVERTAKSNATGRFVIAALVPEGYSGNVMVNVAIGTTTAVGEVTVANSAWAQASLDADIMTGGVGATDAARSAEVPSGTNQSGTPETSDSDSSSASAATSVDVPAATAPGTSAGSSAGSSVGASPGSSAAGGRAGASASGDEIVGSTTIEIPKKDLTVGATTAAPSSAEGSGASISGEVASPVSTGVNISGALPSSASQSATVTNAGMINANNAYIIFDQSQPGQVVGIDIKGIRS